MTNYDHDEDGCAVVPRSACKDVDDNYQCSILENGFDDADCYQRHT